MRKHLTRENIQLAVFVIVMAVGLRLISDASTDNAKEAALRVWESNVTTCREINNPNRSKANENFANLKAFELAAADVRMRAAQRARRAGDEGQAASDQAASDLYKQLGQSVRELDSPKCDELYPKP